MFDIEHERSNKMKKVKVETSMYGIIESDIDTLNVISLYLREAVDNLNNRDRDAMAVDCEKLSDEIYQTLKNIGAYDNL